MSEQPMTDYAKSSDNWLANRYFKQKIFKVNMEDGIVLNTSAIQLDIFEHFAISKRFVVELLADYVRAGLLEYVDSTKTEVKRLE